MNTPAGPPIVKGALECGSEFVSALFMAVRTAQIHEASNQAFERAIVNVHRCATALFEVTGGFSMAFVGESAYLNGARLAFDTGSSGVIRVLQSILDAREIGGIEMRAAPQTEEINKLIAHLAGRSRGDDAQFLQELEAAQIHLLGAQVLVEGEEAVQVDRTILAVNGYAKLLLVVREQLGARGRTAPAKTREEPGRVRAVRVVQDLVGVVSARPDLLLELALNQRGASPAELFGANACLLSVVMGYVLGLSRKDMVDVGVAALFLVAGMAREERALTKDDLRVSVVRLLLAGSLGRSAHLRAAIISEQSGPEDQRARQMPVHLFSRLVGVAAAFCEQLIGLSSSPGRMIDPFEALTAVVRDKSGKHDARMVDLLMNVLRAFPVGAKVVLERGANAVVVDRAPKAPWDRPVVRIAGDSGDLIDLRTTDDGIVGTNIFLGTESPFLETQTPLPDALEFDDQSDGLILPSALVDFLDDAKRANPHTPVPRAPLSRAPLPRNPTPATEPLRAIQDMPELLALTQLISGKYRVLDQIAEGGMGVVYRCVHELMEKEMAIKIVRPELITSQHTLDRFFLEARLICQLDHPNIVRVSDFGREPSGLVYLVMEFLDGEPLAHRIRRRPPLSVNEVLGLTEQILSALEHAHERSIVHRDLKPDNVILVWKKDGWQAKLLDFGIAKLGHKRDSVAITHIGVVVGTPDYMSPEQGVGEEVDARSDLYSLGVMLYELLTGRVPFHDESAAKVIAKHVVEPVPPMNLDLPNKSLAFALDVLIQRALAKAREERFANAAAFRVALNYARSLATSSPALDPLDLIIEDPLIEDPEEMS